MAITARADDFVVAPARIFAAGERMEFTFTMPAGKVRLQAFQDMSAADLDDDTKEVTIAFEASLDGGATWIPWGSGTTRGKRGRVILPGEAPNFRVRPVPPDGALVKVIVRVGNAGARTAIVVRGL